MNIMLFNVKLCEWRGRFLNHACCSWDPLTVASGVCTLIENNVFHFKVVRHSTALLVRCVTGLRLVLMVELLKMTFRR